MSHDPRHTTDEIVQYLKDANIWRKSANSIIIFTVNFEKLKMRKCYWSFLNTQY